MGVGSTKYPTRYPAASSTPMVSSMKTPDDGRASRPTTTYRWSGVVVRSRYATSPAVVRMTTARFIRFDPPSTTPRIPAVPNASVPFIRSASPSVSGLDSKAVSSALVLGSGSPSIHSLVRRSSSLTRMRLPEPRSACEAGGRSLRSAPRSVRPTEGMQAFGSYFVPPPTYYREQPR